MKYLTESPTTGALLVLDAGYFDRPATAAGLVLFPLTKPLFNQYIFMRAGTTLLEEDDIYSLFE